MERKRAIAWSVVGLLLAALAVAEALLFERMHPLQRGTSAEFLAAATNVHLTGRRDQLYGPTMRERGQYIYAIQGLHGQYLYRVPEGEVLRDFPRVLAVLSAGSPTERRGFAAEGYARWSALPDPAQRTPQSLFEKVHEARIELIRRERPGGLRYLAADEADLRDRVAKARRYWMTCVFDLLWMAGMIMLLACPFIGAFRFRRLALAWGIAPLYFYLPCWLGFAVMTRSPWGPNGGVVYPWLLWYSGSMWQAPWEAAFCQALPGVLSPISQDMGWTTMALTGSPGRGPLLAMFWTGGLAGLVIVSYAVCRTGVRGQRPVRGFEVLPGAGCEAEGGLLRQEGEGGPGGRGVR